MEQRTMNTQVETAGREIVLVEDANIRPMMGLEILEPLPSAQIPYPLVDPFILVHEAVVPITPERASLDSTHPHRGFDTFGTRSRALRARATAPVPVARWSGPGWSP